MRRLALTTLLLLAAFAPTASGSSLVEVRPGGPAGVAALERLGAAVDDHADASGRVAAVVPTREVLARVRAAGFAVRVRVADLEGWRAAARERERAAGARSGLPSGRTTYRTPAELDAELTALAGAGPQVREVVLPGASLLGAPIRGVEIATDVARPDDGRPVYLVVGGTHAREWPSPEIAIEFARELAGSGDARMAALRDAVRTIVVPVVNPDGFARSHADQPNRRKTCRPTLGLPPCSVESTGVDLNRNFPVLWGGAGSSGFPSAETYRGTGPWSEPEAAAVRDLSRARQVTAVVSLHNVVPGGQVLRQPGFTARGAATPDEARLKALGDAMGSATGYASLPGWQLGEITGALEDWDYDAHGALAYTIELDGTDFHGPYASHVVEQWAGDGGGGLREALLLAGLAAGDAASHAVLAGTTVPGAELRVRRAFATPLASGATVADVVETATVVPASGSFAWHVGPSTRPYATGPEAWVLECRVGGELRATHDVVVGRGQTAAVDPCVAASVPVVGGTPAGGGAGMAVGGVPSGGAPAGGTPTARVRPSLRVPTASARRSAVRRRGLAVRARCAVRCRAVVEVRRGGRRLGRRAVVLAAGRTTTVRVRLSSVPRGLVAVRLSARPVGGGAAEAVARRVRLR